MERGERLLRVSLVLYVIAALLITAATMAIDRHHFAVSAVLGLVGLAFVVPAAITGRIHNKVSQVNIAALRQVIDQIGLVPVQEADFPWLDRAKLYDWTRDLEISGFDKLGDYTVGAGGVSMEELKLARSFMRIMSDKKRRCFAEIGQSCRPGEAPKDISCAISTIFMSGLRHQTGNGKGSVPRIPMVRNYSVSQIPGVTPEELIRLHIQERDKMAEEQGLTIVEDTSFEAYREHMMAMLKQTRDWANQLIANTTNSDLQI